MIIQMLPPVIAWSNQAGLTSDEYITAAHAIERVAGQWYVQCNQDDESHISVCILSDDDSDNGLIFLLWREEGHLRLDCAQGEFYADLGTHEHIRAAVDAIQAVVEGSAAIKHRMDDLRYGLARTDCVT